MYSVRKTTKPNNNHSRKKTFIIIAVVLVAILVVGVVLELTGVTNFIDSNRAKHYVTTPNTGSRTINQNTKGDGSTGNSTGTNSGSSSSGSSTTNSGSSTNSNDSGDAKAQQTITDPSTPLSAPIGPFVSNHHLGASSPTVQSTCTTTPGATCQIIFTNGSATKSLPVQQTDRGGSAYWSWNLGEIGLTKGSWQITAKAVAGSQTKTATDSMKLEVN